MITNWKPDGRQSFGRLLRICMEIDIILEVMAFPHHFAHLSQFYVCCSADLALDCVVQIFAMPSIHQEVFRPLYDGRFRIIHFVDETCKLPFMLVLEALHRCQG